jgi:hypothetical protein
VIFCHATLLENVRRHGDGMRLALLIMANYGAAAACASQRTVLGREKSPWLCK